MGVMHSAATTKRLDIIFPGLFLSCLRWHQEAGAIDRYPALESFLTNAVVSEKLSASPEALVFSLSADVSVDHVPMAAVRCSADHELQMDSSTVLCADPVSINAGMNDLTVEPATLAADEQQPFTDLINAHLNEQHMSFVLRDEETGLCSGFKDLDIKTSPLSVALKEGLRATLPSGPAAAALQSLSTELQMLLFDAPFNQQREAHGLPPVNGLWFWGEGSLPALKTSYEILSGGKFIADLALATGIKYLSDSPFSFLRDQFKSEMPAALLELTDLNQLDYPDWSAAMTKYEQDFFVPLLQLLKQNAKWQVRLFDDQQRCFTWRPKKWFGFFRKSHNLEYWIKSGIATDE